MKKIVCDVCGKEIASSGLVECFFFYPKEYSQFKNGGNKKYDLCIDCAKAIREVMEEKPKTIIGHVDEVEETSDGLKFHIKTGGRSVGETSFLKQFYELDKEDFEPDWPESPWVHYEKREVDKDPVEDMLITEDDGFITRHDSHGMDIKEGTK